jgi:multidrug resistance protein, MATE family
LKPAVKRFATESTALLRLGAPLIVHNLAHMGMQFTDTVMAGRLSPMDLAAVALGANLWMVTFLLAMGTVMAVSPTVAQLIGAGRDRAVGNWVRQGLWLALFLAAIGWLLLRNGDRLLAAVGIDESVVPLAGDYLSAIAWGLPFLLAYSVLRFTSEGIGHTRPMLFIAVLALPLNAFGNWVLMWGNLGAPQLGAEGCGYASAIIMACMFFALLLYTRLHRVYRPARLFARLDPPSPKRILSLFRLGFPIGIAIFMEGGLFAATALLMGRLGAEVVAAHQIAVNFSATLFMVPLGLAMAITARVGRAVGRGDPEAARYSGLVGMAVCTGFMGLAALFLIFGRSWIAALYTQDPAVATLAMSLLIMAAIFQLSDGLQVGAAGALRGIKDTRIPMFYTVFAYWLIGFPTALAFSVWFDLGPRWIWAGLIVGLSIAAIALSLRFHRMTVNAEKSRPKT